MPCVIQLDLSFTYSSLVYWADVWLCHAVGWVSSSKYEDSACMKLPVMKAVSEPVELSSVGLAYWDSPEKTRVLPSWSQNLLSTYCFCIICSDPYGRIQYSKNRLWCLKQMTHNFLLYFMKNPQDPSLNKRTGHQGICGITPRTGPLVIIAAKKHHQDKTVLWLKGN